jgi:hypothetical protein
MRKITFYLNILVLIIAFAFAIINIYWLIFPTRVIEFQDEVMPVLNENKEVKRGELLQYQIRVCKYVAEEAETVTSFVDGLIFVSDKFTTNKATGCTDKVQSVIVPEVLPTGEYRYRISLTYELNPIRRESFAIETEPFLVIK